MGSRRGHGEGAVYRRASDGLWVASVDLGYVAGKRKRRLVYGRTRREVSEKLKVLMREQQQGLPVAVERQTVGQFLECWLEDTVKPNKAPKTYASYAEVLRLHAIPALGRHRLDRLAPGHVAALLRAKLDAGLSPRRVLHIRAVLRTALNHALRWGLVARNAAALVEPPRQVRREVVPFTVDEARSILAACDNDRLGAVFQVALALGLRQGEVLGLAWDDLDLEAGTLRVRRALQRIDGTLILKEPKTDKSRRTLRLPPFLVTALAAHRDRQAFERQTAGESWQDRDFVFTTASGTPLDPRNVIRAWHAVLARIGVQRRPFHTTRHTAVSVMLAAGVPIKVVQEVLGHTLLSTTADIYGHLFAESFKEAADAMERALAG